VHVWADIQHQKVQLLFCGGVFWRGSELSSSESGAARAAAGHLKSALPTALCCTAHTLPTLDIVALLLSDMCGPRSVIMLCCDSSVARHFKADLGAVGLACIPYVSCTVCVSFMTRAKLPYQPPALCICCVALDARLTLLWHLQFPMAYTDQPSLDRTPHPCQLGSAGVQTSSNHPPPPCDPPPIQPATNSQPPTSGDELGFTRGRSTLHSPA